MKKMGINQPLRSIDRVISEKSKNTITKLMVIGLNKFIEQIKVCLVNYQNHKMKYNSKFLNKRKKKRNNKVMDA